MLDACSFPREKLCGEFLSPEGHLALRRLGLGGRLDSSGPQPIHTVRLSTPRGRALEAVVVGPDGLPGLGLSRSVMDNALIEEACDAGAELVQRSRVSGPMVENGRVVGVRARHATEGRFSVRASLVIAADGRHSSLVHRTGMTRYRSWLRPRHFGLKRHVILPENATSAESPDTVVLHLLPGGYVGACRIEGGWTNICGLLPETMSRSVRGDLDALVEKQFGLNPRLEALWQAGRPVGPWKTVAGVRAQSSRSTLPGIFYTGDCRGTVDPLGGQGMTMALLGAELLAPIVLDALVQGADLRLSRIYEHAWHRRFDRRIRLCRLFHHALVHPGVIDGAS